MSAELHPAAGHDLPGFITPPGETDVWMVAMAIFLVIAVLGVGVLFFRLHTLPERMAHKTHKLQFEIVAVLGLLSLFTHMHIFWVAGLLLALIDLPDFGTPLRRMAGALEKMANIVPGDGMAQDEIINPVMPAAHPVEMPEAGLVARAPLVRVAGTPDETTGRPREHGHKERVHA